MSKKALSRPAPTGAAAVARPRRAVNTPAAYVAGPAPPPHALRLAAAVAGGKLLPSQLLGAATGKVAQTMNSPTTLDSGRPAKRRSVLSSTEPLPDEPPRVMGRAVRARRRDASADAEARRAEGESTLRADELARDVAGVAAVADAGQDGGDVTAAGGTAADEKATATPAALTAQSAARLERPKREQKAADRFVAAPAPPP
eukprot:1735740-Prymnesium_polylepis.1